MASLFKRGRIWWIKYYENGNRMRVSARTDNRNEAMELAVQIEKAKKRSGHYAKYANLRFGELLIDLIREYEVMDRKSIKVLKWKIDAHLTDAFGGLPVEQITTAIISDYRNHRKIKDGAKNDTINHELRIINRAFKLGMENGKIDRMPYIKKLPNHPGRTDYYESDEIQKFIDKSPVWFTRIVLFAIWTGWRRGEILNLKWNDIYFADNIIRIHNTKAEAVRAIKMPASLTKMLKQIHRQRQQNEYVFELSNGQPVTLWHFRVEWKRLREVTKIEKSFHAFRRTARIMMDRAGISERVSMAILGHKTREMHDRYRVVGNADLNEAARKMQIFIGRKGK